MFTGIITCIGRFRGYRRGRLEMLVEAAGLGSKLEKGDSLAVNGVCLSLLQAERDLLSFNLSRETLATTNLGRLKQGETLNLESPLTLSAPLGGHLVTGHADGVGRVLKNADRRPGKRLSVAFPPGLKPYLVPKGSVALNGVSLTVASLGPTSMETEIIPLTLEKTNLGDLRAGDSVNIECDIIGKYVYNWVFQGMKTT